MRFLAVLILSVFLLPLSLAAQERPNTILVLDASGSMWGQIDGVAKITIAQQVITNLLETLPDDENLGLTVYGAERRGDCTDIRTVVPPGTGTKAAIAAAVQGIKPLGKTPMTDAVIAAAQALRYTEDKATVILVSDGVETCNPDPCAAAALLEEAGIDFTAHVIGFDVGSDAEAVRQMQCIADQTGGRFLTAANASELTSALTEVAKAPEPPAAPKLADITFQAFEGLDTVTGDQIRDEQVIWTVTAADGTVVVADKDATGFDLALEEGSYEVSAIRVKTEDVASDTFEVVGIPDYATLFFPRPVVTATLTAADTAMAGTTIQVGWDGPNEDSDNIQIAAVGGAYINYTYVRDGNPVDLIMPIEPGTYELRYVLHDRETIATRPITVTPMEITLTAPETAPIGSIVDVGWTGPDQDSDNIQVAEVGGRYINYAYTSTGNPVKLQMPGTPGTYELRYSFRDRETVATRPITVTAMDVALVAPDTAPGGSTIAVGWTGPDAASDNIQVGSVGGTDYFSYTYTREGNPVNIILPPDAGTYELRYVFRDREVLATRPITVTKIEVGIDAPATAVAGAPLTIGWTGPDAGSDNIQVGGVGGSDYSDYTYTSDGNPLTLNMPTEPGTYELRYVFRDRETLYRQPISITPVSAQLVSAASAQVGTEVTVGWDGPGYDGDYIAISAVGDSGYASYSYIQQGNPLVVTAPDKAGSYEIRYVMGQDDKVIATIPLSVTK